MAGCSTTLRTDECTGKIGRSGEPVSGKLLQRSEYRLFHRGRYPLPHPAGRHGFLGHHFRDDGLGGAGAERRVSGEHLVEHGAQGVHVAARADLPLTHGLLGTHVLRRAEAHAGLSHPACAFAPAHRERNAEVGNPGRPIMQEYVLGLDIAVDHAVAVGVVERARHLAGDPDGVRNGELLLAGEPVAEGFAVDERHHVIDEGRGTRVEGSVTRDS